VAAICETLAGFDNFRSRVANAIGSGMLMPMSSFRHLTSDAPEEARIVRYFLKVAGDDAAQRAAATEIRERFDLRFRFGCDRQPSKSGGAGGVLTTQVFFGLLLAVAV